MNDSVLLLYLLNFMLVGSLPLVFFKQGGRLTRLWWLTASPFILCPLFLTASYFGVIVPVAGYGTFWSHLLELISILVSVGSIALITFTAGTHRIPIALWHQENEAPNSIVTYGAYRWVRHPLYAAFLLAFLGAVIFCPQEGTLFSFLYAFLVLNFTAAREEERLRASEFGLVYEEYARHTGRFWPKWKFFFRDVPE